MWLAGRGGNADADAREAAGSFQAALWRGETGVAWSLVAAPRGEGDPPTAFVDWAERCSTGIPGNPAEWTLSAEPHAEGGRTVAIDAGTRGAVVAYRVVEDPDGWGIADWTPDLACTP